MSGSGNTFGVTIDTSLIPALERKLIGGTFYNAMVRFYEDPKNLRRFEEWQKQREEHIQKEGTS